MSICFLPYVHDQIRDIWMVSGAVRDDPDRFELSVSNANGADLLCTLGLAPEPGGGPVPIEHFAGLVTEAARTPAPSGGRSRSTHMRIALSFVRMVVSSRNMLATMGAVRRSTIRGIMCLSWLANPAR